MRGFALLFGVALIAAACTSAKDKKLTEKNIEAIGRTNELTGEEVGLLQAYVVRTMMTRALNGGGSNLLDSSKTIREAIAEQRKWMRDDAVSTANAKAEADAALRRAEEEAARLRGVVTVTPVRKSFSEADCA